MSVRDRGLRHRLRRALSAAGVLALLGVSSLSADDSELGVVPYSPLHPLDLLRTPSIDSLAQKITVTLQGITFDSDYDNGSLLAVREAGTDTFDCDIYEEPGELGTSKYWFRFRLSGVAGRTVTLNIDHSANPRPVVSTGGGTWRRMTSAEAPNLSRVVLTFTAQQSSAELAFFFPLGYGEINDRVSELVQAGVGGSISELGSSYQGRPMWLVTVTDPAVPDGGKRRVWLHARAHAGEVTASHTMLGFLEQVLEDSPLGRRLRRGCIFNVLPTQNCDGVFLGLTRWDSQGIDPERQWPNPSRIPEVANIRARVDEFMAGPNPIECALNLHSTVGNYADSFFWKHVRPSVTANFEMIEQRYIDSVDHATPLFDNLAPQTSQLSPNLFIESYFWNHWGEAVMALTYEGHYYRRITDAAYITDADYRALGRALAAAMVEYFDLPDVPSGMEGLLLR
jgi:hypothetical protein